MNLNYAMQMLDFPEESERVIDMDDQLKMMLVDDDPTVLELLVDLFADQTGLEVRAYSDSKEALEHLKTYSMDIIITDLMMPDVDGLEILRSARECQPNALVVLITGYGSLETTLKAIDYGAYNYLTKPFQVQEFKLMVKNAIERVRLARRQEHMCLQMRAQEQELEQLRQRCRALEERLEQAGYEKEQEQRLPGLSAGITEGVKPSARTGDLQQYEKMTGPPKDRLMRELRELSRQRREGLISEEEHEQRKRDALLKNMKSDV
ncbi:response regulator [Candidatus Sumerlaeota bacterium]|nr:response regulator [Candidatus Sumerlaeota bacterium]